MALKPFHILLIGTAAVFGIALSFWALRSHSISRDNPSLVLALASFAGALILGGYLLWFLKKMRQKGW